MQRKHPPGSIQRFFKPAVAVCRVDERGAAEGEEEKEATGSKLDDDETENVDANARAPSPSPPRPPATISVAEPQLDTTTLIATYSRRKKRPKAATDEDAGAEAFPTTTTSIPNPSRPPPKQQQQRRPRLTQTHLDLGQASFACSTCPRCGMVYAPGDPTDERLHATFHADALEGPRLPPSLTSVPSSPSSSSAPAALAVVVSYPLSSGGGGERRAGKGDPLRGRVLHAPPGPRSLGCAAVRRAIAVAEAALGSAPGWLLGIPSPGTGGRRRRGGGGGDVDESGDARRSAATPPAAALAPHLAACGKHAFLFECPDTRRAVGIAVVESLASGTKLEVVKSGGNGQAAAGTTTTAGAAGAALGVRGVWVAPSHRRRGVATALLDAARARAITYTVVGRRSLVAFSQPTDVGGGAALAGRYAGNGDGSFLAYFV